MPRRREVPTRDPSRIRSITRPWSRSFINCMMWDGKKSVSERIFYGAMDRIRDRTGEGPAADLQEGCRERQARRRGQVPARRRRELPSADRVRPSRRQSLALRWLIGNARSRSEHSMTERLGTELLEAAQGRGTTIKKKDDVHRMAEANKAFAHLPLVVQPDSRAFRCPVPFRLPATAISVSLPISTRARPPRPSASCTTPGACTAWERCMTARPRWTTWSRSRSAASRSPPRPLPATGAITRSTSSTRPATSTSPPR